MTTPATNRAFPVDDWQFWIVTTAAIIAAAFVLWRVFGGRLRRRAGRRTRTRATLTIDGKPVSDRRG